MDDVNHGGKEATEHVSDTGSHKMKRGSIKGGGFDRFEVRLLLSFVAVTALILYVCATHTRNSEQRGTIYSLHVPRAKGEQQYTDLHIHRLLLEANGSLEQDKETLLRFKALLEKDNPYKGKLYENWLPSDPSPCNWSGITCGTVQDFERVTGINFGEGGLQGTLFNGFSALTALSNLSLGGNMFEGKIPSDLGNCKGLTVLNLSSNFLEGTPDFTALISLQYLDLSANRFNGSIFSVVPNPCDNLSTLNLSVNSFTGLIEDTLPRCTGLKTVDLSENELSGTVWEGVGNMEEVYLCCNNLSDPIAQVFSVPCRLKKLDLSKNNLTGPIPENVNNCRDLVHLDLSENRLFGKIPPQIGLLLMLETLLLHNDSLSRDIPVNLTQCKALKFLDLGGNNFGGSIQPIFGELESLQALILHHNSYVSDISTGIFSLPFLIFLDLSYNKFSGQIPVKFGSMQKLRYILLAGNNFSGNIPPELGQLSQLQILDLSSNSITGPLPPSMGNLANLLWLMLANNSLTGPIPQELGKCKSLLWLNLAFNQISGPFPDALSSMGSNPNDTFKYNQKFLEPIPRQSGECLILTRWLPANYPPFSFVYDILNRRICKQFWQKLLQGTALFQICPKEGEGNVYKPIISGYLQLTGNNLSGSLPASFGKMGFLSLILLGNNNFDGPLPPQIADIPLEGLNVSFNRFSGSLPPSLGDIKCLQMLDLSSNNFSGQIPGTFTNLNELAHFNISYNPLLRGVVPSGGQFNTFEESSYIGDESLCFEYLPNMRSNVTNSRSCTNMNRTHGPAPRISQGGRGRSLRIFVMVISVIASVSTLACGFLTFSLLGKRGPAYSYNSMDSEGYGDADGGGGQELALVKEKSDSNAYGLSTGLNTMHFLKDKQFTYTDILLATANFSDSYVVGRGGFGTVYKGKLRDGSIVAVKKLQQNGPEGEREFLAEMQTLGSHEFHENLVPLRGCCLFGTEKLLVYDFMSNGSLEDWLYEKPGGPKQLDWPTRYKIALGTAKGLKFLHHDCSPAVIHRDMKASNILLAEDFKPHVTDFGLARFMDGGDTHVSTVVAGTLGYVPPEYSQSWRATTKGDVYSFGVVLLELATGRRPLSVCDALNDYNSNLVEWVRMLISGGRAAEALDPMLQVNDDIDYARSRRHRVQLMRFLHLGFFCTDDSPHRRPNMLQLLTSLESLSSL